MQVFSGATADEAWRIAAKTIFDDAEIGVEPGRNGAVKELVHAALVIKDPRQRWVLSRRPAMNPAFAIVEAFWILSGRNDARLVNRWNPSLPHFAGDTSSYPGAYGYRLRRHFSVDQLDRAIDALIANPSSRQVALQIWSAVDDLPATTGAPRSADIPCNTGSFLRVRQNELHWLQVLRSNDLNRGTPYNFVQFTVLQEVVAGCLGVSVGPYTHVCNSLHVYQNDLDTFSFAPKSALRSTSSLLLPKKEAFEAISIFERVLERLGDPALTGAECTDIIRHAVLPPGHHNLLLIAAADIARRLGWDDVMTEAVQGCSDPLLLAVWKKWCERWVRSRELKKAV